eukprot:4215214-Prymnesium_polylepis.1
MSISELSEALSSSSRSLLGGASWVVDISEVHFGKRLGAGAYGEVREKTPTPRGADSNPTPTRLQPATGMHMRPMPPGVH